MKTQFGVKTLVVLATVIVAGSYLQPLAAEPAASIEQRGLEKVKEVIASQPDLGDSEQQSVDLPLGSNDAESVVQDLKVEHGSLVATTVFGEIRVSNASAGLISQVEPGFSTDGAVVLQEAENYVAGYEIIPPGENLAEWELDLPANTELVAGDDGAVDLVYKDPEGGAIALKGFIAAPWAIDTEGNEVGTEYTIAGNSLIQVVDSVEAEVVADPRLTFGYGVYLNMWGWELEAAARAAGGVALGGGMLACNYPHLFPGVARAVVQAVCRVMPGITLNQVWSLLTAPPNLSGSSCYQKRVGGNSGWVTVTAQGNCK